MAHDVFISYPGKDKSVADAVCAKLEENKIRCWIAPRDIPAGKNFAESIIDAIDASKVFVLIWSINTNASEHILNEVNQAFNQGIPIIPFRIQEVEPTSAMRYYFGRKHWLDAITPPLERHIETLATAILSILERTPEVIPEPVVVEAEPVLEQPPARETEVRPPPERDFRQVREVKEKSRSSVKTDTKPPPALPKKKQILIPIAAGVLVVAFLVVILTNGWIKGLTFAEKTKTTPPSMTQVFSTSTTAPPTATITPTPIPDWMEEANVWANPILAAIENQAPDLSDDFSGLDASWKAYSDDRYCPGFDPAGKFGVVDGKLQLSINPSCPFFVFTHPSLTSRNGNFVLQTEIDLAQTSTSYEFVAKNDDGDNVDFILGAEGWVLTVPVVPGTEQMVTVREEGFAEKLNAPVLFTVLKEDETFLFFLDGRMLMSYNVVTDNNGTWGVELLVSNWSDQLTDTQSITLDNLRFWDVDNLFIPERILAQLENVPPSFADDYSKVDTTWQVLENPSGIYMPENAYFEITDGLMRLNFANSRGGLLSYPEMEYSNYVLQVDVDFNDNPMGMEFRMWAQSGGQPNFGFGSDGYWAFEQGIEGVTQFTSSGNIPQSTQPDYSKPVTITIINNSPHFVVFMNEALLFSYDEQMGKGPFLMDFVISSGENLKEDVVVELDNFKIWDLDNLFIPERILAQLENVPPSFADDFSQVDPTWQLLENTSGNYYPENADFNITDGLMRLSLANYEEGRGGILSHPRMRYSNYVLQTDVHFLDDQVGIEFRTWDPLVPEYYFWLQGNGEWNYIERSGEPILQNISGVIPPGMQPDFSKPFTLTIIKSSPYYVVYLNSSRLFSYSQQFGGGPSTLDFQILPVSPSNERFTVELDTVKIWDLDN